MYALHQLFYVLYVLLVVGRPYCLDNRNFTDTEETGASCASCLGMSIALSCCS